VLLRSDVAQAVGKYNRSVNSFGKVTIGRESLIFILNKKKGATLNSDEEIDEAAWRLYEFDAGPAGPGH
jgi:hypothetical protein